MEFEDGTIIGFFFDEPEFLSWWGPALADELKARGEDVAELLTAVKFTLADPERQARARTRYLDARAETWGRTLYGRQSDWCRAHGVFSSGHFLEHDRDYYNLGLGCGNVMQQLKYVEVPGIDLIGGQYYPHQREDRRRQIAFGQMPKYASSVAHVYNRHNGLNWCEIFGACGQKLTYPQMKWMCDWHQSQGCYYLIPHSFNPKAQTAGLLPQVERPVGTPLSATVKETVTPVSVPQPGPKVRVTKSPFAESVETTLAFTAPELKPGQRAFLVCDDVAGERSAEVRVNGVFAGGFIGAPYHLDVTRAVKPGANTLTLRPFRVTNPKIVLAN